MLATLVYGVINAVIAGVSMGLLRRPSPWLYAIGGAVLAVIPGIGPAMIAIPAFVAALELPTWQPLAIVAWGIAYYTLDSAYSCPKIFGEMLHLPMFVVLLAVLLGGTLMGIWGTVLAVPIAAALQLTILDMMGRRPAAEQ